MFCRNCGKELEEGVSFCPNCGSKQNESVTFVSSRLNGETDNSNEGKSAPYNTMCIIGLVVSAISILINFWGLVGMAGIILSVIGVTTCAKTGERGKNLATIGVAIGVCSVVYAFVIILGLW